MAKYRKATVAGTTFFVEMDEKPWYGATETEQQELAAELKDLAKVRECLALTIVVVPDPIFPMYETTERRCVYRDTWPAEGAPLYEVETYYTGVIAFDTWQSLSEKARVDLTRTVRDALNARGETHPGRYEIRLVGAAAHVIERGRV